jgi:hypothetical protein
MPEFIRVLAACTMFTTVAAAHIHTAAEPSSGRYKADYGPGVMPGVHDDRGCVRICDYDTNPCDAPSFKRADGRCSL